MSMRRVLQICVAVFCFTLLITNVLWWRQDRALAHRRAAHATDFSLSLDECEEMLKDLESVNQDRLVKWRVRLRHHIAWSSASKPRNLADLVTLYRTKEFPARSNYFADLVFNLSLQQRLPKASLLEFLGPPD